MLTPEKCLENAKKDDKITGKNIDLKKISLGNPENKNLGKFRYTITPIVLRKNLFKSLNVEK